MTEKAYILVLDTLASCLAKVHGDAEMEEKINRAISVLVSEESRRPARSAPISGALSEGIGEVGLEGP